jgi:hypothetical protein
LELEYLYDIVHHLMKMGDTEEVVVVEVETVVVIMVVMMNSGDDGDRWVVYVCTDGQCTAKRYKWWPTRRVVEV